MGKEIDAKTQPDDDRQPSDAAVPAAEGYEKADVPPPSSPPPRGPKLRYILVAVAAFIVIFWLGSALGGPISNGLHKLWRAFEGNEAAATDGSSQYYTCGMHPWVILPKPGDCPICQMKLVPLDAAKFTGEVTINPVVAQDIGVRVTPVTSGPVVRTIRTVGTVTYDETRVRDVNIKVSGWIEKLHVDYLGAPVKKEQPLFDIYSPELYVAEEEYLLAWKNRDKVSTYRGSGTIPETSNLLRSARKKLEYLDITPQQITELEKRGEAGKTVTVLSPYEGVVIAKHAVEGMKVNTGMQVYRIADLSKLWVMVTLYEYQLPYVQLGQNATMSLTYLPGHEFKGKVIYIYPYLDSKTRQVDVRLEFENPAGLLKPGMYANIDLHSTLAKDRVLAPRSAIIDTGERKVAFVSLGEGRFDPRNVRTGAEAQDGMVEVLDGLKPGEKVVTSGQFLIDSEANVREALAKMIKGDLASEQKPSVATVGASELKALPEDAAKSLQRILEGYLTIQKKLAADSNEGIAEPANGIARQVDELLKVNLPDAPHFWHTHMETAVVRGKALELAQAKSLDQTRLAFADLSVALDKLLKATGVPPDFGQEIQELHCPMYREGQGGTVWLQAAGDVRNPYFGSAMLECFDQRKALPVTGQQQTETPKPPPAGRPSPAEQPAKEPGAALPAEEQKQVNALAGLYLKAHALLVKDQYQGVPELLNDIQAAATNLGTSTNPAVAGAAKKAAQVGGAEAHNLDEVRVQYKELSETVIDLLKLAPPGVDVAPVLYQVHCPMAKGDWLQTVEEVANPYYGSKMLTCGEVVGTIGSTKTK